MKRHNFLHFFSIFLQKIALFLILIYQNTLSPFCGMFCRHTPTCSHYAYQAITDYGVFKGIYLTFKRLIRCRPRGTYGFDPVPEILSKETKSTEEQRVN